MKARKVQGYGYRPDLGDPRDHRYSGTAAPAKDVDLRPNMPAPVWDQGQLGSCVWHGTPAVLLYALRSAAFMPSRLWGYYQTRKLEGDVKQDGGCEIRDAIKVLAKLGCPPESEWPYAISKFAKAPPAKLTKDAAPHEIKAYERIDGAADGTQLGKLLSALSEGLPIVFGTTLYESFESAAVAAGGVVPMPKKGEQVVGGHCMAIFGAKMKSRVFIVRNSWGAGWGDGGYCTVPFDYLGNPDLTTDCWVIRA